MIVYRYEDSNKVGPYSGAWKFVGKLVAAHGLSDNHPGLSDFPDLELALKKLGNGYVFACPSINKFYKWFYGFHAELKAAGFKVSEYLLNYNADVIFGNSMNQVIFQRGEAKLERQFSI